MTPPPSSLDHEQTIVKPTPGGIKRATALKPKMLPALPEGIATPELDELMRGGMPPLVIAAMPLLALVRQLHATPVEPDVEDLRMRVIDAIKVFERKSLLSGVAPEGARAAHYALCATIDDIVLNTPWGGYSTWARQGMVSTFHMDVTGGERFFDLLDFLHRDPGNNRDVLLLIYICLSLGFEGRMRVRPRGMLELSRIREGLYRTLRSSFGDATRDLSPHWEGVSARHRPVSTSLALWTIAAASLLGLAGMFLWFTLALNDLSDDTLRAFAKAAPYDTATLAQVRSNGNDGRAQTFMAFLEPEVKAKLVSVEPKDGGVLVRIRNQGIFASGSAEVEDDFLKLFNRIGQAIADHKARVHVIGHTDTMPIRTARFPSNWHLSEARAQAVAALFADQVNKINITAEGRGDTEPVATNKTPEGREANRRTDLIVRFQPVSAP